MKVSLRNVEKEFIDLASSLTYSLGIGEAAGKIWATLVLIDKPLSQQELKELTNYSLSVISVNLSILEKWGLIRRVGKIGKRKLYKAKATLIDILQYFLREISDAKLTPLIKFLDEHIDEFNASTRKNALRLLSEYNKARYIIMLYLELIRKIKLFSFNELKNIVDIRQYLTAD